MKKKAIVVGAGIGGIVTGILLSRKNYQVEIFEKNPFPGGRCSGFFRDGHRFDAGATMLMMPGVFEGLYKSIGKSFTTELQLSRVDPLYRVWFENDLKIDVSPDLVKLKSQLENIEVGSYNKFLKYMDQSTRSFKLALKHFIIKNFYSVFDMINLKNLLLMFRVNAHKSYYGSVNKYFKSDILRHIFTLQTLYLGLNPAKTPGMFYSLPSMELSDGSWFPKGGMRQVAENLFSIAKENGVQFHLNAPVKHIETENGIATGIMLEDGSSRTAGILIVNADLPYTCNNLLPDKYKNPRLNRLQYTCSALVFHWGMDTIIPGLEQHNVFISGEHGKYLDSVFSNGDLPQVPTFYLHSPARTDET